MGIKNWEHIDASMQRGYVHAMSNSDVPACIEWKKTWNAILMAMDSGDYGSIEDFDEDFRGQQCIFNWASDYEMALMNATTDDISFANDMISFCTEYLKRSSDKHEHNCLNMRTAIANSYFRLGMVEAGEKAYLDLTSEIPKWGWGWIKWSYEYSSYEENRDYSKAIEILKKGLDVDGVDEVYVIKEQLKEVYEDCGMQEEANSIIIDDCDYGGVPLSEIGNVANTLSKELNTAVNDLITPSIKPTQTKKVGRNEPCPCKSGKKYKKCCGF